MGWDKIWQDQQDFNLLLRPTPANFAEQSSQTRDFALELISEMIELLRTSAWKKHRNKPTLPNISATEEELADLFKNFITLCQIWGVSPERLEELYWRKSMVVRQRYAEEWVKTIDRPCVLVDLDNVVCDYIAGICEWMLDRPAGCGNDDTRQLIYNIKKHHTYIDTTVTTAIPGWKNLKHEFRTSGAKAHMPTMPGAKKFMDWCREMGWLIVILTSRPIDRYPNMYGDTLAWLHSHRIPFDFIWWASDKAERVPEEIKDKIVFAVDDDEQYVMQYKQAGIPVFWVRDRTAGAWPEDVHPVQSVQDIQPLMENHIWQTLQTLATVPTPSTPDKNPPPASTEGPMD